MNQYKRMSFTHNFIVEPGSVYCYIACVGSHGSSHEVPPCFLESISGKPGDSYAKKSRLCGRVSRQRPIFPRGPPRSIVGAEELNFRVRDGNGCTLFATITGSPAHTGGSVRQSLYYHDSISLSIPFFQNAGLCNAPHATPERKSLGGDTSRPARGRPPPCPPL